MSARDDVAQIIANAADKYRALPGGRTPTTQDHAAADALLAEGYTKARTITTVEELTQLSRGAVLTSSYWADAFSYVGGTDSPTKLLNVATGKHVTIGEDDDFYPAAVIYEFRWAK